MDELDLMQIPPMVQLGPHSILVHVAEHPDGVEVELRHPNVGGKAYRVMKTAVVADLSSVLDWIGLVAGSVEQRLDAELRLTMKQAGYRT